MSEDVSLKAATEATTTAHTLAATRAATVDVPWRQYLPDLDIPPEVAESPEFMAILQFPKRYSRSPTLGRVAALIEVWLYRRPAHGLSPVFRPRQRLEPGDSEDPSSEAGVWQVPYSIGELAEAEVVNSAWVAAKTSAEEESRKLSAEKLLGKKGAYQPLWLDSYRKQIQKFKKDGSVDFVVGNFEFPHMPVLLLGQIARTSGHYASSLLQMNSAAREAALSAAAMLHEFTVNYYATLICRLVAPQGDKNSFGVKVRASVLGRRLYDSFDFRGSQSLSSIWTADTPSGTRHFVSLSNESFRRFRTEAMPMMNRGSQDPLVCQDFYLTSNMDTWSAPTDMPWLDIPDADSWLGLTK